MFNGRVPDRVVVALMHQGCFKNAYYRNPFNFVKAKLTSIKQLVEGGEWPYLPLEINRDNDQRDVEGYHRLIKAGCADWRRKCMIKPEHWGEGKTTTLFKWDNVENNC